MKLLRRLKNLWKLSELAIREMPGQNTKILVKDIVTVKKQPAKIVNIPEDPFFEPNEIKEV